MIPRGEWHQVIERVSAMISMVRVWCVPALRMLREPRRDDPLEDLSQRQIERWTEGPL